MRSLRRISQVPAGDLKSHDRATRDEWGECPPLTGVRLSSRLHKPNPMSAEHPLQDVYLPFDHSSKRSLVAHVCGDGLP